MDSTHATVTSPRFARLYAQTAARLADSQAAAAKWREFERAGFWARVWTAMRWGGQPTGQRAGEEVAK